MIIKSLVRYLGAFDTHKYTTNERKEEGNSPNLIQDPHGYYY